MLPTLTHCPCCNSRVASTAYECVRCGHVFIPLGNRSRWFLYAAQLFCLPFIVMLIILLTCLALMAR